MQKILFHDGGYVIHKIPYGTKNRISAWFDNSNQIIAAEFMPSGREVKRGGPAWQLAQEAARKILFQK